MFVTGPDVIRTVTHEEVTKEELGGAMTHNARAGVAHFAVDDDRACLALIRELLSYLPPNNLEDPPVGRDRRPGGPRGRGARHAGAGRARTSPTTSRRSSGRWSTTALPRGARALRPEHRGRLRAPRRPHRRRSSPTSRRVLAGCLDIDASVKARALRALLRRLQHPARHLRGRARLPARHRPGVRRHHPPRREAALRLRRGDRAQDHRDHAQGLRRRLLRDGEQAHPRRRQLRLAARPRSP